MSAQFTNIAAYKFARLADLKAMRVRLVDQCREDDLKGTILLSTEGINLFVAGRESAVEKLLATLRAVPGLEQLRAKYSESGSQPFNRMLVRIKKEIIAFGVEGIEPERRTSPKLEPRILKQWLDEGRKVTLLDTRNQYEVKLGTFHGAKTLDINNFRQFPEAVKSLPEEMKQQEIVMFCTGGIRCEKAGPFMEREGFQHIHQLEGGILKYFEECGGDHYDGECFVFDKRVGVDPALHETATLKCFACQEPLSQEDQEDPRYDPPRSCPYCFRSSADLEQERRAASQARLNLVTNPLPGSTPEVQHKPVSVSPRFQGKCLAEFLATAFSHISADEWAGQFKEERVLDEKLAPVAPDREVKAGQRFYIKQTPLIEPDVAGNISLIYEDAALIVLNKPAPLPVHPCGRFERNTLSHFLQLAFAPLRPRPAHRLDANTTGVIVFTKTHHFAGLVQPQFDRGEVEKTYLAQVIGLPDWDTITCDAGISKEPGEVGVRTVDEEGLPATTVFSVVKRDKERSITTIQAKPLTGRTNQIRVHLWNLGFPVKGDPAYLPNGQTGAKQTLLPTDPPMHLHSWRLGFNHPLTLQPIEFEAKPPWADQPSYGITVT